MNKIKLAIVGATGLVGRAIIDVIQERNIPVEKCKLFCSERSAGQVINVFGKDIVSDGTVQGSGVHIDVAQPGRYAVGQSTLTGTGSTNDEYELAFVDFEIDTV